MFPQTTSSISKIRFIGAKNSIFKAHNIALFTVPDDDYVWDIAIYLQQLHQLALQEIATNQLFLDQGQILISIANDLPLPNVPFVLPTTDNWRKLKVSRINNFALEPSEAVVVLFDDTPANCYKTFKIDKLL